MKNLIKLLLILTLFSCSEKNNFNKDGFYVNGEFHPTPYGYYSIDDSSQYSFYFLSHDAYKLKSVELDFISIHEVEPFLGINGVYEFDITVNEFDRDIRMIGYVFDCPIDREGNHECDGAMLDYATLDISIEFGIFYYGYSDTDTLQGRFTGRLKEL
jgi:hypothetical protein